MFKTVIVGVRDVAHTLDAVALARVLTPGGELHLVHAYPPAPAAWTEAGPWQAMLGGGADRLLHDVARDTGIEGPLHAIPDVSPARALQAAAHDAFALFTQEIGLRWRRGTRYWNDPERALSMRIEPYVDGRFLELYDVEAEDGFEVGRVTAWEPGERLALTWTQVGWPDDAWTDIEITFTAAGEGTLVRLEQTGFERTGVDAADFRAGCEGGWRTILGWFAEHAQARHD